MNSKRTNFIIDEIAQDYKTILSYEDYIEGIPLCSTDETMHI